MPQRSHLRTQPRRPVLTLLTFFSSGEWTNAKTATSTSTWTRLTMGLLSRPFSIFSATVNCGYFQQRSTTDCLFLCPHGRSDTGWNCRRRSRLLAQGNAVFEDFAASLLLWRHKTTSCFDCWATPFRLNRFAHLHGSATASPVLPPRLLIGHGYPPGRFVVLSLYDGVAERRISARSRDFAVEAV
jgi:hypothetical protein